MEKVLLTGGSGMLGKSIIKIFHKQKYKLFFPKRNELDLTNSIKNFYLSVVPACIQKI